MNGAVELYSVHGDLLRLTRQELDWWNIICSVSCTVMDTVTVVAPRPGKRGRRRRPGCLVISLCWPVQAPAKQWLVTWWSTLRHPAVIHHIITTRDHRVAWQVRYATTSDMWLSFRVHRCRLWRNFFISYLCKLSSHHDVGRALRNVCYCDITFLVAYS